MLTSQHGSMYAEICPLSGVSMATWYIHCIYIQLYIPTTFSGCERFFSTAVLLLSSILHVYTPSSPESTLQSLWMKAVPEHAVRETTTTPLWSHFREETGVELEKEEIMNRQLYFKTSGIQLFVIVRDVTSGVHSMPNLDYFSIEVSTLHW